MKTSIVCGLAAGAIVLGFAALTGRPQSGYSGETRETTGASSSVANPPRPAAAFVAHEWGTFTSFQTADGKLQTWRPLETSKLPGFVYDWQKPGLKRVATSLLVAGKGRIDSLQRMETPVIYFYSHISQSVDVTVAFPEGAVTEWYPQASLIGPARLPPAAVSATDAEATASTNSVIRWRNVRVGPLQPSDEHSIAPLTDNSGSHYFSARDTDADLVRLAPASSDDPTPAESEKFLFYRGVGNFATPLTVTMRSADAVEVSNTGKEPLAHLFILGIKGDTGRYVSVSKLAPGATRTVLITGGRSLPVKELAECLSQEMAAALADTGLFPREAKAMVNTWRDSWFQEPGVRVLYALPRAWTDQTLPMRIAPAPDTLVRTMVGRAEVLPPDVEARLVTLFQKVERGDQPASDEARRTLEGLGRFAYPAFGEVLARVNPQPQESAALSALLTAPPASN